MKSEENTAPEAETELEASSPLEQMLEGAASEPAPRLLAPAGVATSLIGEIVDDRHPALRGRVRVRWTDLEGQMFEKWLPTLQNMPVRVSDRVLLTQPANWPELVVTGVLDGFARRPEVERESNAELELKRDEAIRVRSQGGEDLLEVFEDERGPVVRLLTGDVDLDIPGAMRIRADSITLEAKKGQARIEASDDVVVRGETVHLN